MLNQQKPHIGIFGKCNVGKSTFINVLSNQQVSIVSEHPGTTTDAVKKSIEMGELGPVILIDTAGMGDVSLLGTQRIAGTQKIIQEIDVAIILVNNNCWEEEEALLSEEMKKWKVPFFILHNQSDLAPLENSFKTKINQEQQVEVLEFSCKDDKNIEAIISLLQKKIPKDFRLTPSLLGDLVSYGDVVVLVTPIDIEAPKGRLILPQVQTIRDALDHECIVIVVKERELELVFKQHNIKPKLVVTDSQAFLKVAALVPEGIPLTSFSILQARLKGDFASLIEGTYAINKLKEGDLVLIMESCAHHIGGEDIGKVKIPRWLELYKGCKLNFEWVSGLDKLSQNIDSYALVVQCGGCMLTTKQVNNRVLPFLQKKIPVTNYGLVIAFSLGIFARALSPFSHLSLRDDVYL